MQKKRRTREEERLRWATALLRLSVLLWLAVLLLCLVSPDCFAAAETTAANEPDVTWLAAIGAVTIVYHGMNLVLKLDEPGKRGKRAR